MGKFWRIAAARQCHGTLSLGDSFPTRTELADALRRLMEAGISLEGASDHGVSEAIYLRDPGKNGGATLHIYGRSRYRDIEDVEHEVHFCGEYQDIEGLKDPLALVLCPTYNETIDIE